MSSPTDIPRVPPIFQNYEQLGDFVIPTSNSNSYVSIKRVDNYIGYYERIIFLCDYLRYLWNYYFQFLL